MPAEPLIILLAEDDDGHARLFQRNLERAGIANQVVRVVDGQAALDYAQGKGGYASNERTGPLLVLLDIGIPQVDGVEVLCRLKAADDCKQLPVIMISALADPAKIKHCYALGCSAYIIKPFEYDEFVEILGRLGLFLHLITRKAAASSPRPYQFAPAG